MLRLFSVVVESFSGLSQFPPLFGVRHRSHTSSSSWTVEVRGKDEQSGKENAVTLPWTEEKGKRRLGWQQWGVSG